MAASTNALASYGEFSIRSKQKDAVRKMLNFNSPYGTQQLGGSDTLWKVLVMDTFCRDLLAPILKVSDLRQEGVTLHMMLHSAREQIPDVPAVYFVLPNPDNIRRIGNDLKNGLYDSYHLNFASTLPRPLMEELARVALECEAVSQISKVFDQYLNFISLEDSLFHLNHDNSYVDFHDPTISDAKAEENVKRTVDALFAAIVALGVVPIIRCPRGDAAQMVAEKLDAKLRDHLNTVGNLLENASWNRPVLIILDRNIDLSVMVGHAWTYQALMHDILGMNLNRVKMEVKESGLDGSNKPALKTYDLDCDEPFLRDNGGNALPKVAVEVQTQVNEIQEQTKKATAAGAAAPSANGDSDESSSVLRTKEIQEIVSSLPQLQERKRLLDMHTNIALEMIDQINKRGLDSYYSLEEAMMTKPSSQHIKEVAALIKDSKGTANDKIRLFLIFFMSQKQMDKGQLDELEHALIDACGPSSSVALNYFKKIHAFNESWATVGSASSATKQTGFRADLFKTFSNIVSASVKYLVPADKNYHVTRIVDQLMELKDTQGGLENYLYFDPKSSLPTPPRKNTPFKEAIVFVIGGGNYVEYQNLQDYAKGFAQKTGGAAKKIIYGSTELITANQFLEQVTTLAPKF